ncbi:MAG: alpha/beta hydrolase family protein [Opitutales bacterium]
MNRSISLYIAGFLSLTHALTASSIVFESDFESNKGTPVGWSEESLINTEKDGNRYLQGSAVNESSKAKATTSYTFSPVKEALSLEFEYQALKQQNWSTFLSIRLSDFELFRLLTVNYRVQIETIAGTGSHIIQRKQALGIWTKVRLDITPTKEMDNVVAYVNGKLQGIYSVPSLYQQSIDQIAFGRLAKVDNLKITSGETAFEMPENSDKYKVLNELAGKQRDPSKRIPINTDPISLFLDRTVPVVVKKVGQETTDNINVQKLTFLARPAMPAYDLLKSEVYTIVAEPKAPGRYPGILILHGGTGTAEEDQTIAWAKQGYVAMSISIPGVTHPSKSHHAEGVARLPYGFNRFSASPDAASSPLMDAFIAGVKAFQLLEKHPKVESSKIGLTGISWGGFTTTAVAGLLGDRLAAAFSVYGCGFLEDSALANQINKMAGPEKEMWLKYIDAGRRASNITAPYFIVGATNDSHFWPIAIERTLSAIPGPTNLLLAPNENHKASVPGGTIAKNKPGYLGMETPYFAYHLKNEGVPFPEIKVEESVSNLKSVRFTIKSHVGTDFPKLYYTVDTDADWRKRAWKEAKVEEAGKATYSSTLPETGPEGIYWFALASDNQSKVTVSSRLQHTMP